MKTYGCVEMKLDKAPFEKIKSGEKTIELRLYDAKRWKIRIGVTSYSPAATAESILQGA